MIAADGASTFSGMSPTTRPRVRLRIVFEHVAHHASRRLRAVAPAADDQDPPLVDDRAPFEVAAAVRQAGDLGPFLRGRVVPVAGRHVNLRDVVAVVAAQRVHLAVSTAALTWPRGSGISASRSPLFPAIQRQAPVIRRVRVAVGLVAAEIVQLPSDHRQAAARAPFRQVRAGGPAVRGDVVFPDFRARRPGVLALETAREPDGLSVDGRVEVVSRIGMSFLRVQESLAGS